MRAFVLLALVAAMVLADNAQPIVVSYHTAKGGPVTVNIPSGGRIVKVPGAQITSKKPQVLLNNQQ